MQHHVSKRSVWAWILLAVIGLIGLLITLLIQRNPKRIIRNGLKKYGLSPLEINYWICVSAFETAAWTSQVYKDSNNLFGLIVPGKPRLPYGEGQTIYGSPENSVQDLYREVIKYFSYDLVHPSLQALVTEMGAKGYYRSDVQVYYSGTLHYLNQFYPGQL